MFVYILFYFSWVTEHHIIDCELGIKLTPWLTPQNKTSLAGYTFITVVRFNSLMTRENGRDFADDIFKCIFMNENV